MGKKQIWNQIYPLLMAVFSLQLAMLYLSKWDCMYIFEHVFLFYAQ